MTIVFRDEALAGLCNSRTHLEARWGETLGAEIARRLFELNAVDPATVHSLPRARVGAEPDGTFLVRFQHGLVVRYERGSVNPADDYFVIIDIYANEEER